MTKINTDFIMPFIEATHTTFERMMNYTITRKEVYLKKNYVMLGDISGFIGLSGKACGTAAVSLPAPFALKCIGTMMGQDNEMELTDSVVHDGVGEIVNMIAGRAKTTLGETEYKFDITLPTIISGRAHELYHKQGTTILSMVFETESGDEFAIDVSTQDG